MTAFEELRVEAVTSRGLDPAAASFVTGTILAEIEQSADDLARVIAQHVQPVAEGEPARHEFGPDFFSRQAADKAQRQRDLLDALSGRRQERDEQGRFAQSGGFDGGARESIPAPRDPEREHGDLLAVLATASRVYRGGFSA